MGRLAVEPEPRRRDSRGGRVPDPYDQSFTVFCRFDGGEGQAARFDFNQAGRRGETQARLDRRVKTGQGMVEGVGLLLCARFQPVAPVRLDGVVKLVLAQQLGAGSFQARPGVVAAGLKDQRGGASRHSAKA